MNGLDAVNVMEQGKMVTAKNSPFVYKIENRTMLSSVDSQRWRVSTSFDFSATYEEWSLDSKRYESAGYCSTEERAEAMKFKQELFRKLQYFSDANGGLEIDWENHHQRKFYIYHIPGRNEFHAHSVVVDSPFGTVYFISEEVAEKAIKLFREELIKYFNL